MGERKGQNFYYPPDFDYKTHGNLNRYHGVHALRERAHKLHEGILIIRFEMPFNIWCLGCHNHVGMGVRYNAEKKKIGMYYTTPLYEFRMKCHLCDNYYVIRTDPKNFDYELVEGCSRQEKRYDPTTIDQLAAVDRGFNQKLAADAMFKAEHEEKDKSTAQSEEKRMDSIEYVQERLRDDFAANQALRKQFRRGKNELSEKRARDDDLLKRTSLSIKLAPEDPDDKRIASMLTRYSTVKSHEARQEEVRSQIHNKRIFGGPGPSTSATSTSVMSSSERLKQAVREQRNKRINQEFISSSPTMAKMQLGVVKRPKSEPAYSESGSNESFAGLRQLDDVKDVKPPVNEVKDVKPTETPSLGLLAGYGSDDSD